MTFTYNPNLPNPPDDPADDVFGMQTNSQSINNLIAVDHISFNQAFGSGGFHKTIRQAQVDSTPAVVPPIAPFPGFGQIFTRTRTITQQGGGTATDGQLFYQTPGGGVSQLTGYNQSTKGYTMLPGVMMQWGLLPHVAGSDNETFNVVFGDIPYSLQVTPVGNILSSSTRISVTISNLTASGFSLQSALVNASVTGFYWIAIGKPPALLP